MSTEERLADLERRIAELEAWRGEVSEAGAAPAAADSEGTVAPGEPGDGESGDGDDVTEDQRRARRMGPGG